VKYVELGNAARAGREAGYSPRTASHGTHRILTNPAIAARLKELGQRAEDEAVANVVERKRRLTEIVRGRVTDYLNDTGDGFAVDRSSANPGALEQLSIRTSPGRDGEGAETIVDVKLHDPVRAIAELNKMERVYTEGTVVNQTVLIREIVMVRPEPRTLGGPPSTEGPEAVD
jgi:hypothetical protein